MKCLIKYCEKKGNYVPISGANKSRQWRRSSSSDAKPTDIPVGLRIFEGP